MTSAGHLFMCPPRHYEVSYTINPWMRPDSWEMRKQENHDLAQRQWSELYRTIRSTGVDISLATPALNAPDMVFTANAAIVLDRRAVMARFRHPERQVEEPFFQEHFQRFKERGLIDDIVTLPENLPQEGAGDCIWDHHRRQFWAGYGPRSHKSAADFISSYFEQTVVPLELATDAYYHLDVCMCPLMGGDIIYFPPAFTDEAVARLKEMAGDPAHLIEAQEEDASAFAVNAVNIDRTIIMASCSDRLRGQLTERGYRVEVVPLTMFTMSGGAAFCLTLRLDRSTTDTPLTTQKLESLAD